MLLMGIYQLLIAIAITKWKSISGFWKFEILRSFWKAFQYSKCLKGCQRLVCPVRYLKRIERSLLILETHFCLADSFWTAKPIRFTLVSLSDKTCKIVGSFLQDDAIFVLKIARIFRKVQKMQGLRRFWLETSDFTSARNVCWADQTSIFYWKKLARFFRTCKLSPLL